MVMTIKVICANIFFVLAMLIFSGCSSTKEVESWRSPDSKNTKFKKVLILGMTEDPKVRAIFEDKLTKILYKNRINSISSLEFFGPAFKSVPQTIEEWKPFEQKLVDENFDSVIITKVIGVEEVDANSAIVRNINQYFATFKEDMVQNNDLYKEDVKDYYIHHVATTLYCICPGNEEDNIIWKLQLDIKQPIDTEYLIEQGVNKFSQKFIKALKNQDLFITKIPE